MWPDAKSERCQTSAALANDCRVASASARCARWLGGGLYSVRVSCLLIRPPL